MSLPRRKLSEITAALSIAERSGPGDVCVTDVTCDSRTASPGSLFVAIRGFATDGHRFIPHALSRGAVCVVYEDRDAASLVPPGVTALRVPGSRLAPAELATAFWGHPSKQLCMAAVTGTNGKTTVAHLLEAVFRAQEAGTAIIGTLGRTIADQHYDADRTTPDAVELQRLLAQLVGRGIRFVSMEVSSHALALDRVHGTKFDIAVLTNLTRDHLDFHAGEDEYLATKLRLFTDYADMARPEKELLGVINADDAHAPAFWREARCRTVSYGIEAPEATVRAEAVGYDAQGSSFEVLCGGEKTTARLQLAGRFNILNALAAIAAGVGRGISMATTVEALEQVEAIPGRFERIEMGQDFAVIVDYAHTPDALQNVLQAARQLRPQRLICVFGCGGDRDRGKRPLMGKIASELADITIVTSDNPRSEDPHAIIADIVAGTVGDRVITEPDRVAAIRHAFWLSEPQDLVLIAGKGHETYQIFADRTVPFDDREVARAALRELLGSAEA